MTLLMGVNAVCTDVMATMAKKNETRLTQRQGDCGQILCYIFFMALFYLKIDESEPRKVLRRDDLSLDWPVWGKPTTYRPTSEGVEDGRVGRSEMDGASIFFLSISVFNFESPSLSIIKLLEFYKCV